MQELLPVCVTVSLHQFIYVHCVSPFVLRLSDVYTPVCLSICVASVCCLYTNLSVHLCCVCLLSIHQSICPFVLRLSAVYTLVCLSICVFVCLLSILPSVCLIIVSSWLHVSISVDQAVDLYVSDIGTGAFGEALATPLFRGCRRQPLYCFHFDFRYVTLVR